MSIARSIGRKDIFWKNGGYEKLPIYITQIACIT